jgi:hypothetical protein
VGKVDYQIWTHLVILVPLPCSSRSSTCIIGKLAALQKVLQVEQSQVDAALAQSSMQIISKTLLLTKLPATLILYNPNILFDATVSMLLV